MWYNTRQGGVFMVDLKVSSKEYDSLSNRTKRKVFEELAHRILILHPEYLEEAKALVLPILVSKLSRISVLYCIFAFSSSF